MRIHSTSGTSSSITYGCTLRFHLLAVGKLIGKVAVELREVFANLSLAPRTMKRLTRSLEWEAAPKYQDLLIELEALNRGLQQLQTLQSAENELHHLDAIRAASFICRRPLEDFLARV